MNVEVVQRRLWEQSQQHRKHMHQPQRIATVCDRVLKRSKESRQSGKPDAWKLARPVWGWGRGEIPRPTPQWILVWHTSRPRRKFEWDEPCPTGRSNKNIYVPTERVG